MALLVKGGGTLMAADGRRNSSNKSSKRPRPLRLPALRAEWRRAQRDPEWISALPRQFSALREAGELPAGHVLAFYRRFSNVCADSSKVVQGWPRRRPSTFDRQCVGRDAAYYRNKDTGWVNREFHWEKM